MATGVRLSRSVVRDSEEYFEFTCSPCKKESKNVVEAEVFCNECSEYLCCRCLKFHNKFEMMKAHTMLEKDGMRAQGHQKPLSVPTETCDKHHGRIIDTYCSDHDEICCVTCVSLKHKLCGGLMYLSDAAEGISTGNTMKNFKDSLGKLKLKLNKLEKQKRGSLEESDRETKKAKDKLQKTYALIIEHLDKIMKKSINEVAESDRERKQQITTDIELVTKMMSEVKATENIVDLSTEKNESKLFVNIKRSEMMVNTLNEKVEQMELSNTDELEFTITQQLLDFTDQVNSFGKLTKMELNWQTCKVAKLGNECKVQLQGEKLCNITSMCQIEDGSIILSDYDNKKLKRLGASYRVRDTLQLPGNPIQVCSSGVNELAVALLLQKKIQFVSITDNMHLTQRQISVGEWYCGGVACFEDKIFVTLYNINRTVNCLKIFNKKGDLLKTVDNDSKGQCLFTHVWRLLVSEFDGTVYVTDAKIGVISLDRQGNLLATYSNDDLQYAVNLFALGKDVLLVCDIDRHTVVKIDRNKAAATVLLGQGDGIQEPPQSVLVDRKTSKLLVGMDDSANILVFDMV